MFIDENILLASATEETYNDITADQLRSTIKNFIFGEMEDDDYSIYDGAIYTCGVASNHCLGDPSEHEEMTTALITRLTGLKIMMTRLQPKFAQPKYW